jgi:cobalt/nickel transport system permease protein
MAGTHAVIGIGEALITCAVLAAVAAARPDLVPAWARTGSPAAVPAQAAPRRVWVFVAAGAAVALALAVFVSPFASSSPDGLEKVAADKGFMDKAAEGEHVVWKGAPFPDYTVSAIGNEGVSTGTAGFIGVAAVLAAGYLGIRLLNRGRGGTDGAHAH